jgi:hypothetical protein
LTARYEDFVTKYAANEDAIRKVVVNMKEERDRVAELWMMLGELARQQRDESEKGQIDGMAGMRTMNERARELVRTMDLLKVSVRDG